MEFGCSDPADHVIPVSFGQLTCLCCSRRQIFGGVFSKTENGKNIFFGGWNPGDGAREAEPRASVL